MNGCYGPELPPEFVIPEHIDGERHKDAIKNIKQLEKVYETMPAEYKSHKGVRLLVLTTLVIGIVMAILATHGVFNLSPVQFSHVFTTYLNNVNWIKVGIGVGIFLILMVGATIIIRRVMNKHDPVTGASGGKFSGDEHWIPMADRRIHDGAAGEHDGYVDTSTLTGDQKKAHIYGPKTAVEHYSIIPSVALSTPLHTATVIAYNVIRLIVIPFVILGAIIAEKVKGAPYNENNPFKAKHILIEMGRSLWNIIRAPFYATAIILGALYALIDPLNGRKLISYVERDWNNDVPLIRGFWVTKVTGLLWCNTDRGPYGALMDRWQFEGAGYVNSKDEFSGFSPDRLGKTAFYYAGCMQPTATAYYDEEGKNISSLRGWQSEIDETYYGYAGYTREMTLNKANDFQKTFQQK